jgi:hypothetical protein
MTTTSDVLACMGGPENISLAKHEAAMTALKKDKQFSLRTGEAGAIKNIKIEGEKVIVELETYTKQKSIRVYQTKLAYPNDLNHCDERVATLLESKIVKSFDSEKTCAPCAPAAGETVQ